MNAAVTGEAAELSHQHSILFISRQFLVEGATRRVA